MPEFPPGDTLKFKGVLHFRDTGDVHTACIETVRYHDDGGEVRDENGAVEVHGDSDLRAALDGKRVKITIEVLPPFDEWYTSVDGDSGPRYQVKGKGYVLVAGYPLYGPTRRWRWEHHTKGGACTLDGTYYSSQEECKVAALRECFGIEP